MTALPKDTATNALASIFGGAGQYVAKRPRLKLMLEQAGQDIAKMFENITARKAHVVLGNMTMSVLSLHQAARLSHEKFAVDAEWSGHPSAILAQTPWLSRLMAMCLDDQGAEATTPDRSFTNIEKAIAGKLMGEFATAIYAAFAGVLEPPRKLGEIAADWDPKWLSKERLPVLIATFVVSQGDFVGTLELVLPRALLDTLPLDAVPGVNTGSVADPEWSARLEAGVHRANVDLRFVLGEWSSTLGEMMSLRIGQVVALEVTPQSMIRAESNDQPVLLCQLGKSQGRLTAKVDRFADREREFVHGLLSH